MSGEDVLSSWNRDGMSKDPIKTVRGLIRCSVFTSLGDGKETSLSSVDNRMGDPRSSVTEVTVTKYPLPSRRRGPMTT